jgi:UDP-N-acetylmuramoyl-L-alanyl-D-glutamate--2,6-diaminopimelate ligase
MGYDHIGDNEHKDFNEYLMCKKQIFKQSKCVAVNRDTEHFNDIIANENCEIITFGFNDDADFIGSSPSYQTINNTFQTSFYCKNKLELHKFDLAIPGRFSVENALGAISAMRKIGVSYDDIRTGLRIAIVTGRMEILPNTNNKIVIIDYAHNEMSMKSLFETVKLYSSKRIINVFGAGGNRSKLRRYTMGEVSGNLADLSIITSDNPRYEKLEDIIDDIIIGMKKTNGEYIIVKDRREAIHKALSLAKDGEIILLCGKGQQDYEEIEGIKYHLNERDVVNDYFSSLSGK